MMLKKELNRKFSFMRVVSQMMAIVLTIATVLTVSPGVGHASLVPTPGPNTIISATAAISNSNKMVKIIFNTIVSPAISLEDLKANIQIKRSGANSFTDLSADNANNMISMTAEGAIEITLNAALTGTTNAINVKTGSVKDGGGITNAGDVTVSDIAADITPPVYTGSTSENNGEGLYLNFDESVSLNNNNVAVANDTFLRSKISVATDGEHYVPLSEQSNVNINVSRKIYISYLNHMKIIVGKNTLIKIASGTLMDQAGNANTEMILHVTPPIIKSTELSIDNHDVTITFEQSVVDNTYDGHLSYLREYIKLIKGADSVQNPLVEGDTAKLVSGKLKIHFAEALSGATNQITISNNALKDAYGNILSEYRLTSLIQANVGGVDPAPADTTAPKLLDCYLIHSYQDLILVFDENVFNAAADDASFKQNLQWFDPDYGYRNALPSDSILTFSGHTVTIHFAAPLAGNSYDLRLYNNHFKDEVGNVQNGIIDTNWLYPMDLNFRNGYLIHDGNWMSLEFNVSGNSLTDQTIVNGVSHLKEQITISEDHGLNFSPLNSLDIVSVQKNRIIVFFHAAKKIGSVEVKLPAGVVSDLHDNKRNIAVDRVIANNTPTITGYVLSNAASEFVFAENAAWTSKVGEIRINDQNIQVDRVLTSSEYTLAAGKLTINNGIFQEGHFYGIYVEAEGYSTEYFEGRAYKSSEIFYMTAPVMTAANGITASVNLFNNANANNYTYYNQFLHATTGTQTVIFELMNGTTPVSIAASNLRVIDGTYSASFNVPDAGTNPNYTVKAYIVSKYNNDPATVGLNMATLKTQNELDQAISNTENYSNNMDS